MVFLEPQLFHFVVDPIEDFVVSIDRTIVLYSDSQSFQRSIDDFSYISIEFEANLNLNLQLALSAHFLQQPEPLLPYPLVVLGCQFFII